MASYVFTIIKFDIVFQAAYSVCPIVAWTIVKYIVWRHNKRFIGANFIKRNKSLFWPRNKPNLSKCENISVLITISIQKPLFSMINLLSLMSWPLVSMSGQGLIFCAVLIVMLYTIKPNTWVGCRCTQQALNYQQYHRQWMSGDLRIRRWKVSLHHQFRGFHTKIYYIIFMIIEHCLSS